MMEGKDWSAAGMVATAFSGFMGLATGYTHSAMRRRMHMLYSFIMTRGMYRN